MAKRRFVLVVMFAVLIQTVAGAGIDGRWIGTLSSPEGDVQLTFTFYVEGNSLSGSVKSPAGTWPISNGQISGENFSFDLMMDSATISYQCAIEGDTIDVLAEGPWGELELTLTRP